MFDNINCKIHDCLNNVEGHCKSDIPVVITLAEDDHHFFFECDQMCFNAVYDDGLEA